MLGVESWTSMVEILLRMLLTVQLMTKTTMTFELPVAIAKEMYIATEDSNII